jgi:hypothetical protein
VDKEEFVYTGANSHSESSHYYMRLRDLEARLKTGGGLYEPDYEGLPKVPFPVWDEDGTPLAENNDFLLSIRASNEAKKSIDNRMKIQFAFYCGMSFPN